MMAIFDSLFLESAESSLLSRIDDSNSKDLLNLSRFDRVDENPELSDAALYTRIEAAAHSACRFFGLPDIVMQEGEDICVYRGKDIFINKDVFMYNLEQFKEMGCTSFEDMTKVWAHECGHRLLRMEYDSSWAQELGSDFFVGVRSETLGLPMGNFEKFLIDTPASRSHPPGELRIQAIQYGRDIVHKIKAEGNPVTFNECKAYFENSPFSKIDTTSEVASFVNDKAFHYREAVKAQKNVEYYDLQAQEAAQRGDYAKSKEYIQKTEQYESKVKDEKQAAENDAALVDMTNKSDSENSSAGSVEQEVKNRERRLPFNKQTMNNDELEEWRKNPENENKLILGEPHSGQILRHNLSVVTGERPENSSAHHIVGNETPNAAKKLDEFGIDRNDPANGINLPNSSDSDCRGSLHTGRHLKSYYEEVERRFQNVSSREEALEVLQSLKEDLYNGKLSLQKDVLPNK